MDRLWVGILGRVVGDGVTGSGIGGGREIGSTTKLDSKSKLTCFEDGVDVVVGADGERVGRVGLVATDGKDAGMGDDTRVTGRESGRGARSSGAACTSLGAMGV